jgi:hypothetical protein
MTAVFVSNNGAAARHSDYVCDTDYGAFLSQDVIPWAPRRCDRAAGSRTTAS